MPNLRRIRSPCRRQARLIGDPTGGSIKKFVHTTRRHRRVLIPAGYRILTTEDPSVDLSNATRGHSLDPIMRSHLAVTWPKSGIPYTEFTYAVNPSISHLLLVICRSPDFVCVLAGRLIRVLG
jgi:hypothetical protein